MPSPPCHSMDFNIQEVFGWSLGEALPIERLRNTALITANESGSLVLIKAMRANQPFGSGSLFVGERVS